MNPITEKIFYVSDENQNQRFIISAMTETPRVWKISKYEDMLMGEFGLMRLTFVQEAFNNAIDFVDYNATNPDGSRDVFAMYANYYESALLPESFEDDKTVLESCIISASTNSIKAGGSYKTITAKFCDASGNDITDSHLSDLTIANWSFYIDDVEIKNGELITVLEQDCGNRIKIRFANDTSYLTKTLMIKCSVNGSVGTLSLAITNL